MMKIALPALSYLTLDTYFISPVLTFLILHIAGRYAGIVVLVAQFIPSPPCNQNPQPQQMQIVNRLIVIRPAEHQQRLAL